MITMQNLSYAQPIQSKNLEIPSKSHEFQAPSYIRRTHSHHKTSSVKQKVSTKEEWLAKYKERLELIVRIHKALDNRSPLDFSTVDAEYEVDLPQPEKVLLSVAYRHYNIPLVLLYYRLTNSDSKQWVKDVFENAQPGSLKEYLLFLIKLVQSNPSFVPKHLIQYYLSKDLKGDMDYDYQGFWRLLVDFKTAFKLSSKEILEGLTRKELNAILTKNATKLDISRADIKDAKDRLSQTVSMSSVIHKLFG